MKRLRTSVAVVLGLSLLAPSVVSARMLPGDMNKLGSEEDREKERKRRIAGEPGSGVPLDRQIRPTDSGRLQAPLPLRPKDASESEALDTMEELLGRYKSAQEAAAHTVASQLKIGGAQGRRALENHYDRQIRDHQAKARKMRAQAIRRYGDFLKVHPDDATWTPEIGRAHV